MSQRIVVRFVHACRPTSGLENVKIPVPAKVSFIAVPSASKPHSLAHHINAMVRFLKTHRPASLNASWNLRLRFGEMYTSSNVRPVEWVTHLYEAEWQMMKSTKPSEIHVTRSNVPVDPEA